MANKKIEPRVFMAGEIEYAMMENVIVGDCNLRELVDTYGEGHWSEMIADAARSAVDVILAYYTVTQKPVKRPAVGKRPRSRRPAAKFEVSEQAEK